MNISKLFFVVSLFLIVNVFSSIGNPLSLISIDLNDQNKSMQIENLKIPVIYKIDQVVLLKVNQDQLLKLERADIKFTLLDQDITDNSYYLADIIILSKNDQIKSKSIGSLSNYIILKNVDKESIRNLSQKTHISQLDITSSQPFYNNIYIPNQTATDIDPLIIPVIEDINRDSVEFVINRLQQYGTRFMLAPNRFEVSEWIYDQFTRFGFTEVEYDTFTAYTSISYQFVNEDTFTVQRNIVATLPGSDDPEAVFIVCGHYDSFNSYADPFQIAPGADDDASGVYYYRLIYDAGFVQTKKLVMIK